MSKRINPGKFYLSSMFEKSKTVMTIDFLFDEPLHPWQQEIMDLDEEYYNEIVLLWSRRQGKDYVMWKKMIKRAIIYPGTKHLYVFPTERAALNIMFDGISLSGIKYIDMIPKKYIKRIIRSPLSIELINNSTIMFQGLGGKTSKSSKTSADDSLGVDWKTVLFTEAGTMENLLAMKGKVLPATKLIKGARYFIGTPRGYNDYYTVWQEAEARKRSYASKITCEVNFSSEEIVESKEEYGPRISQWEQEYMCSFEAAIEDSVAGPGIRKSYIDNELACHSGHLLWVSFDLGVGKNNALWIIQTEKKGDYYVYKFIFSLTGMDEPFSYYISKIKSIARQTGCVIGGVFLPHDSGTRNYVNKETRRDMLKKAGLKPISVDNLKIDRKAGGSSRSETISVTRDFLIEQDVRFGQGCVHGLAALKMYGYACPIRGIVESDSSSAHEYDAFRYCVLGLRKVGLLKVISKDPEVKRIKERNTRYRAKGLSILVPHLLPSEL